MDKEINKKIIYETKILSEWTNITLYYTTVLIILKESKTFADFFFCLGHSFLYLLFLKKKKYFQYLESNLGF